MKMKSKIQFVPIYNFEELTEAQYKAVCTLMLDYPSGFWNKGIQIKGYGGIFGDEACYHYTIELDTHVRNREDFELDRANSYCTEILVSKLVKRMDEIVDEFKKVIEANEEPVST